MVIVATDLHDKRRTTGFHVCLAGLSSFLFSHLLYVLILPLQNGFVLFTPLYFGSR